MMRRFITAHVHCADLFTFCANSAVLNASQLERSFVGRAWRLIDVSFRACFAVQMTEL